MKGFIEVTDTGDNAENQIIRVDSILRVLNVEPVLIITKELVSRYECSNDNVQIYVKESYEQIKELIKQAQ